MSDYSFLEYFDTDIKSSLAKDIIRKIIVNIASSDGPSSSLGFAWHQMNVQQQKEILRYWLYLADLSISNRIGTHHHNVRSNAND